MKAFVYILRDNNDRFYVGSTTDIGRRLKQHRHGHTATTHRMNGPEVVLIQECLSLKVAREIEKRIKKLKRHDYVEKMVADGYISLKVQEDTTPS